MPKTKKIEFKTARDLLLLYDGWLIMDKMERSQSLNRDALLRIVEKAFRNS